MRESTPTQGADFLKWMAEELGGIQPFKPCAWYDKNFDWFIYIGQDVSYTEITTSSPHLELFKSNADDKIVGFKLVEFGSLPHELRNRFVQATGDLDDVGHIEDIWILNMIEMAPEMAASEVEFFKELRARSLQ